MMGTSPPPQRSRLASAGLLLVTLIGMAVPPAALATMIGWPLPAWPIDFGRVAESVTAGLVPSSVWVNVLATAAWLAWLYLMAVLVIEVVAVARNRPTSTSTPRWARHTAQILVSAAFTVAVPAQTMLSGAPAPAPATTPADDVGDALDELVAPPADAPAGARLVRVEASDSWAGWADTVLGDRSLGPELRDANLGREVAGGQIDIDTVFVEAGWTLAVPGSSPVDAGPRRPSVSPAAPKPQPGPSRSLDPKPVADATDEWTVEPGDDMWQIAEETLEQELGRAPTDDEVTSYWHEVIEANEDNLLPPHDEDMIYPDQVLHLPPVASASQAPPQTDPAEPPPAQDDPDNEVDGEAQTDVETDVEADEGEGVVEPESEVPSSGGASGSATASPAPSPEAVPRPAEEAAADVRSSGGSSASATAAPQVDQAEDSPPRAAAAEAPAQHAGASPERLASREDLAGSSPDADDVADEETSESVVVISTLGLAAAGLVGVLRRMRTRRIRRRKPGMAPPPPPDTSTERSLHTVAEQDSAWKIDRALRALVNSLDEDDPPRLVGAHFDGDRLTLLLDSPMAPPPGWSHPVSDDDGANEQEWTRELSAMGDDELVEAGRMSAPWPTLVSLGRGSDGNLVMLNLEELGAVQVRGQHGSITATMATMAVELATSPMTIDMDIVCVGFGHGLDAFERVTVADAEDHTALFRRLEDLTDDVAGLVEARPSSSPAVSGRVAGVADSWIPTVVFDPMGSATAPIRRLVDRHPRTGLVLVTGASAPDCEWGIEVDDDTVHLVRGGRRLGDPFAPPLLQDVFDVEELQDISRLIDDARNSSDVRYPEGSRHAGADAGHDERDVLVRVLGPVEVQGRTRDIRRSRSVEVLAYLALHPDGASASRLMEILWPGEAPDRDQLNRVISEARTALVPSSDGTSPLPRAKMSRYRVSPAVGCDLSQMLDLRDRAIDAPAEQALDLRRQALELVKGEPFVGIDKGWGWAHSEGHATAAVIAIDDIALRLATDLIGRGDYDAARWAAQRGLLGSTGSIELYKVRLEIAGATRSMVEAEAIMEEARATLTDDDGPEYSDMLLNDLHDAFGGVKQILGA